MGSRVAAVFLFCSVAACKSSDDLAVSGAAGGGTAGAGGTGARDASSHGGSSGTPLPNTGGSGGTPLPNTGGGGTVLTGATLVASLKSTHIGSKTPDHFGAGQNAWFGLSVAQSGTTLFVGVPQDGSDASGAPQNLSGSSTVASGAVETFVGDGSSFRPEAFLKAPNPASGDRLGTILAVSRDTLVVGVSNDASGATGIGGDMSDASAPASGAVHVFDRAGGAWQHAAYIKASDARAGDRFGDSVALDGDVLAVGALHAAAKSGTQTVSGAGAVYTFERTGGAWQEKQRITAQNPGRDDGFGIAAALAGDVLLVSALGMEQQSSLPLEAGVVHSFHRAAGAFVEDSVIQMASPDRYDHFGSAMALSGDTLVIGAPNEDGTPGAAQTDNGIVDSGAAYVYVRSAASWQLAQTLKASNAGAGDKFGFALAIDGNHLVVGAYEESSAATGLNGNQGDDSRSSAGAAYVFSASGTTWTQQGYLKKSAGAATGEFFAYSLALSGNRLAVGAYLDDSDPSGVGAFYTTDSGVVEVYDLRWQ